MSLKKWISVAVAILVAYAANLLTVQSLLSIDLTLTPENKHQIDNAIRIRSALPAGKIENRTYVISETDVSEVLHMGTT